MPQLLIAFAAAIVTAFVFFRIFERAIIFEHERAVRYRNGRLVEVLGPGRHWLVRAFNTLRRVDVRRQMLTVPSQEVVTADSVSLKVSVAVEVEVISPADAVSKTDNYMTALYLRVQLALRDFVAKLKADEFLSQRQSAGKVLLEACSKAAAEIGLKLHLVEIKDVVFPGELKKAFAQVVLAQKEGLAILERTRGETAALRNLANAAKILEEHPALLQLRALQNAGNGAGHTFVIGVPAATPPMVARPPGESKQA